MEKYKSYGTSSQTTHFLGVFCGASEVQRCTEAQAGVVQDGLTTTEVHTGTQVLQKWPEETGGLTFKRSLKAGYSELFRQQKDMTLTYKLQADQAAKLQKHWSQDQEAADLNQSLG